MKWTVSGAVLVLLVLVAVSLLQGRSLRHASLIDGMNCLKVAYDDYTKEGYVTNYPTSSYRISLSTNVAVVGGTQYQCFAEVAGGWGYEGGTLAMTTNKIFIWLDPKRAAKIINVGYIPPLLSGATDKMNPQPGKVGETR